jgi:hypothetical protein
MWNTALAGWLAGSLVALGAAPFQGKKPPTPKPVVPFAGSYDEALARAADRNVPLLVFAFHVEPGETHEDVDAYRKEIFARPDMAALAPQIVLAVGGTGVHEPASLEVEADGAKTKLSLCSQYRSETCLQHQKLFDSIYKEHNVEGELKSPATILIDPDRKVVQTWLTGGAASWDDVLTAVKQAQAKAGEGLTDAQLVEVRALLTRASGELEKGAFGAAWASYSRVLGITTKTVYAQKAREGEATARESIEDARKSARASFAEGKHVEAYRALDELRAALVGTPLEKELARELAAMEKDKAAKDAIAVWKRSQEAEKLWNEALELDAREPKKAEAKLRTLLRKFADTPAGARAAARYPELAADEARKKQEAGGG